MHQSCTYIIRDVSYLHGRCGREIEDLRHLYAFKHTNMAATIAEGIVKMENIFADKNMPPGGAMAFIE